MASDVSDGGLLIEVIPAYNLIIDSNAETPATYAPTAAHLGVKVTNTGATSLRDIEVMFGNFDTATGAGTPGFYPVTTILESDPIRDYWGTFSFIHEGGVIDATRPVVDLAPGESTVIYVLVSYPSLDARGESVAGAASVVEDDLRLDYDVWAKASQGGQDLLVYDERYMICRNEISAMANKIQPNTTGKVPDEYLNAIKESLGWHPGTGEPRVAGAYVSAGIWYDLGNVGAGFDNDGDLIPDRNAWLQPVGDPNLYDASSTRLVKTYGLLIIKLNDGTEQLVPFEDQLYFQNIPEGNTGVVGLVYYEFLPLTYGGSSTLTPYQEVASGHDNEKFNGDFGLGITSVSFAAPAIAFDKSGPILVGLNGQVTFSLAVTNNDSSTGLGFPSSSLPPVIKDSIPAGTIYVAGSARAVTLPSGMTSRVRYSTDSGLSWSDIEPIANLVTDLQWWLNGELPPQKTFTVEFRVAVPADYAPLIVENCGGISLGGNETFLDDCHVVPVSGPYKIGDTVFVDGGAGGGIVGDGVQNGTEAGLANIGVKLYLDSNNNGIVDPNDVLLQTTTTNGAGLYEFAGLRGGKYLVMVDQTDPDRPNGWIVSTASALVITIAGADNLTADFGFSPALDVEKTLLGTSPVNEGSLVSYRLDVTNLTKQSDYAVTLSRQQDLWMTSATGTFTTPSNAAGATTGNFATSGTSGQVLVGSNPIDPATADQRTPIIHVEAAIDMRVSALFSDTDFLTLNVTRSGTLVGTYPINGNAINPFVSATTTGIITVNVTDITGGWTWADLTAANTTLGVTYTKDSRTTSTVSIDRIGFRVTTVSAQSRDGQLYWSDASSTFKTGPTTGREIEVLMPSLAGSVSDAAFDELNNLVYVSYGKTIDIRTPDGTFVRSFTTPSTVTGLDVAPAVGKLFWSETGSIKSSNLDGTGVMTIVSGLQSVQGLAVDPGAQQVFWIQANSNNVKINRANFDGSGQVAIYDDGMGLSGNKNPRDIEINRQSGKIYFTSSVGPTGGFIGFVNANGTNPTVLVNGLTTPTGLALDINDGMMFWADSQGIKSATLTGTGITTLYPNLGTVKEVEIPFFKFATFGTIDINRTLSYVPLTDDYDPAKMRFVSASVAPSGVDTTTGLITWDNIGDINPTVTKSIIVTFEVLQPAGNATDANILNTAAVVDAKTATGVIVNDDTDAVTITVNPTATIGDFIWQDKTGGTNGVYNAGIDAVIPGVKVELRSADGSTLIAITYTDSMGLYSFAGLAIPDGGSTTYQVWVDTTTLPTGSTNTFDATGALDSKSTLTLTNPAGAIGPADNLSQDFGYTFTTAIVYGNLWNDYDADASRDTLDGGLAGVTVRLLSSTGTVVATTTTLADGSYRFSSVAAGNYTIDVVTATLPTASGTWGQTVELPAETAFDGTLSNQIAISLSAGEINGANDFGYRLRGTASIGDQVFFDLDKDLIQDPSEEGIPGVSVNLYFDADRDGIFNAAIDPLVSTVATDPLGKYLFGNLPAGIYFVAVDQSDPDFPESVAGLVENPTSVLVYSGTTRLDVDFPYFPHGDGGISGSVWNDKNFNQLIGAGEPYLPSIEVQLWVDMNGDGTYQQIATTSTDASGSYQFDNLPYSNYRVILNTSDPDIPLSYSGSPLSPTTPTTTSVTLTSANPTGEANFGLAALPSIGDVVYYDTNANGTQDTTELGITGVTLRLFLDSNSDGIPDGSAIATTTTANGLGAVPAGYYQFTNVPPTASGQSYIVVVDTTTLPYPMLNSGDPDRDGVAWTGTPDSFPNADSRDSGITVVSTSYSGADFGYVPRGVIGDYVWIDMDGDRVQDSNEIGLEGVTVRVTNGTTTYTAVTDGDGRYSFANLPAGTWTVAISGTPLANMVPTFDADGGLNNSTSVTINSSGQVTNAFGSLGVDFGVRLNGPYSLAGTVVNNDSRIPGIADDVDNLLDDKDDFDVGPDDETELEGQVVYLYQVVGSSLLLVSSTTTDANGDYAFVNLPDGDYKVVLDTTSVPLQNTLLTTTANDTPATTITVTTNSVIQAVTIAGSNVEGVDYAFVPTVAYDFGDLPWVYNATGIGNDGARHIIPTTGSTIYLGTAPDADINGPNSQFADGDDRVGADDEDGVVPLNIASWVNGIGGGQLQVTIPAGKTGYLVGWIDFNHDDTLIDQGELIISQTIVGTGVPQTITFDIPAGTIGAVDEAWLSRFRIFAEAPAFPLFSYTGVATDGEVEDHLFRRSVGSAIGDRVWMDTDGDGVQDQGEFGVPGVTVQLRNSVGTLIATTVTSNGTQDIDGDGVIDPIGFYRFPGLAAADYTVRVLPPAGYSVGYDENSGTTNPDGVTSVTLAATTQHFTADFGLKSTLADISGIVFYDANHDNLFGGDTGLGAVTVQLWTDPNGDGDPSDGIQFAESYTGTDGAYLFQDVPSYRYVIVEVDPEFYTSDADTFGSLTDNLIPVVLAGVDSNGNNFLDDGPLPHSISGTVFNDGGPGTSSSNVFDGTDTPLAGVTLTLYIDADGDGLIGPADPLVDTTVTAADGSYTFPNLPAGRYLVTETDPAGFTSDSPNLIVLALTTANVTGINFLDDERSPDGDLSVTKTDGRTENIPGGTTVYTIDVTNSGPTLAKGARFVDDIPSALTGVTWTAIYIGVGSTGPLSGSGDIDVLIDLVASGIAKFTVTGTVAASFTGLLSNVATITPPADFIDPILGNNGATDTTDIIPAADLTITKVENKAVGTPGESLGYTIVVTNQGPSGVVGAIVSDPLPATFLNATWSVVYAGVGATGPASGTGSIQATVSLPVGATATFTVSGTITSAAIGTLVNIATVNVPSGYVDTDLTNNAATEETPLVPSGDLRITKDDGKTTVRAGESITYTIEAWNAGPSDAVNAKVNDLFPTDFTSVSWAASYAGGASGPTSGSGSLVNVLVNLPAAIGAKATFLVTGTIPASAAPGTLSNTASIVAPSGFTETNLSNNSATDIDTLTRGGDLSITKTDGVQTTSLGSTLSYTIVVTNSGPSDVTGVTVTDPLPANLGFVSATGGATHSGGTVTFVSGLIPAGGSTSFVVSATVSTGVANETISNTATVTPPAGYTDSNSGNNSAIDTTTLLVAGYDLQVTKTDGQTTARVGDAITYTIVVSNSGPATATNVTVSDTIPGGISGATWTASGDAGVVNLPASGTGNIAIGAGQGLQVPAGKSATFLVTGTVALVAAGQTLTNTVTVLADGSDVNSGNNTATDTTGVIPQTDLQVAKSSTSPVVPGQNVTYTILVTNNGPISVTGAKVTDVLPAGTIFVSATGGATHSNGTLSYTSGTLENGGTASFTVTLAVDPSLLGMLSNTATVTPPDGVIDPVPSNNTATDTDPLAPRVDLRLVKSTTMTEAVPGLPVNYTIVVTNDGPSFASGAIVTDNIPGTLSGGSWSVFYTGASAGGPLVGSGNIDAQVDLPVGGTATFTITATLDPSATGTLTNTASVAAPLGYTDPTPANNTDPESLPISPKGDLSIVKSDNKEIGRSGESLVYTLLVTNHGPSAVDNAVVNDPLPVGFIGATWSAAYSAGSSGSALSGSGSISGLLVDMLPGGTATITITGMIVGSATGTLSNTATVAAPANFTDTDPSNNADTELTPIVPRGDLSITKTDGQTSATPGAPISYTIVVSNAGPSDATAVVMNDTLPSSITTPTWSAVYSGGSSGPLSGSGSLSGLSLNILSSGTATFTVTGTINATAIGTIVNTATIVPPAGYEDTDPTNNSAIDNTTLDPIVDLAIAKTNNVTSIVPGRNTTYTITVTNNGPISVTGATVIDVLPAGTTFLSATGGATYNSVTNTVSYVTGQILASNSEGFTVTLAVSPSLLGTLTNTATVQPPAGIPEINPANNSASDTDPLTPQADLRLSKTNNLSSVTPGTNTTYTITVANDGPSTVTGATVIDVLPTGTTFVSATNGATYDGITKTVTFVAGTLAKNALTTFTITLGISESLTGTLANTATVSPPAGVTDPSVADNTSTDTDLLLPQANLKLTKTNNVTFLLPGTQTSYAFVVTNNGPSQVSDAVVSDVLPVGLTYTSQAGGATYDPATRTVSYLTGLLALGESKTFSVNVDIASTASGSLTNTATVSPPAGVTDPQLADNTASDTDPLVRTTNLKVDKSNGVNNLVPGELATYTLTITNSGPAAVEFASVTDQLPASLEYLSSTGGMSYDIGTNRLRGITPALAVGETYSFQVTAIVKPDATGSATNTATVTPPPGVIDSDPGDDSDADSDPLVPTVNLKIIKTNSVTSLVPGSQTTYTITVTNNGPSSVTGAMVVDVLPSGTTFVSASGEAGYFSATNSVRASLGTLATGNSESFTVTLLVGATATGSIANTATVTPPTGVVESDNIDNASTDTDPVALSADLRIIKGNGLNSLTPGMQTTYTISVFNDGPSTITGASIVDVLPAGLTFVSATGGATQSGGTVSRTTGTIAMGGSESFTVTVLVGAGVTGSIANTATVSPPNGVTDPDGSDNASTDTDPIPTEADLSITKSDGSGVYQEGGTAVYTIVVTNNSASSVFGVRVQDALPAGVVSATWTAVFSTGSAGPASGNGAIDQLVTLSAGGSAIYTFRAVIGQSTSGKLVNTATVTPPAWLADPNPSNNSATDIDKLPIVVTGTEVGCTSSPMITVIDPYTNAVRRQFTLFEPAFRGGVRVSVGDVDGDGVDEIIAAPGVGRVGEIRVFRQDGTELTAYRTFPFGTAYRNGVEIAVGDIDGDGDDDIVAAASRGAGDVRVFQVNPGAADPVADTPIKSFRAFAASFLGGATVAVADLGTYSGGTTVDSNVPDGKMEIVVGSGAGMRATVQNYDVSGTPRLIDTLLPLPSTFRNGVSVSSARVNGDAIDDVIVASGRGGSTVRETFDGRISPATNALLHRDAVFADIGATAAPLFSAPIDLDGDHIADKFFHTLGDQATKPYPGVRATDPAGTGDQTISQLNFSQRIAASRVSRTQPIQTTASGLMIQGVSVGNGAVPAITQQVTIHFVATTSNGNVVRNTREARQPLSFRLDSTAVMPGLREAIQSMRVGGTRRVIVPPSLQTGSVPSGLPTGNELVFEIELISATN